MWGRLNKKESDKTEKFITGIQIVELTGTCFIGEKK